MALLSPEDSHCGWNLQNEVVGCACAFAGRKQVALMFVGDGEDSATERSLVIATLPIVSMVLLCDGVQGTLSGVLRGVGNQATGTALNAVAYLLVRCVGCAVARAQAKGV